MPAVEIIPPCAVQACVVRAQSEAAEARPDLGCTPDPLGPLKAPALTPQLSGRWIMDGQHRDLDTTLHGSNSQRRKLVKKPPPSARQNHSSSLSTDGRVDAQSLVSKRSSSSLRRAPTAPLSRAATTASSTKTSSPRYPQSATFAPSTRPNHSPVLPAGDFAPAHSPAAAAAAVWADRDSDRHQQAQRLHSSQSTLSHRRSQSHNVYPSSHQQQHQPPAHHHQHDHPHQPHQPPNPLSSQSPEEFVGAPFDGTAILSRLDGSHPNNAAPSPGLPHISRPFPSPLPTSTTAVGSAAASPSHTAPRGAPVLRHSASFSNALPAMSEKSGSNKGADGPSSLKRFSDEAKEPRMPGVLRKKSGFSGFMTSLVGTPKKPLISFPENPVHVTHVGYDSTTGQFTVCRFLSCRC